MAPSTVGLAGLRTDTLRVLAFLLLSETVRAQTGDGGLTQGVDNQKGNEGPSNTSANLSKGAIIAIAVVVAATVILGVTSAVLFYLAKKRQWQVRQTIRRTATRVKEAMTPRTATKMTFSPNAVSKANRARFPEPDDDNYDDTHPIRGKSRFGRDRDVEKGRTPKVVAITPESIGLAAPKGGFDRQKKRPQNLDTAKSQFEMDSPADLKSPIMSRIFGRG